MKKKVIAVLLAAAMVANITACGNAEPSVSDITGSRDAVEEDTEVPEETDEEEVEEQVPEEPEEEKPEVKGVVFGSDEATGYSGFEYLMEELISTSETKSGERASFTVFIPEEDYPSVSGSRAQGDRMGVSFEIDVAPYIQYNAQDYTISENLKKHVDDEFSYSSYKYGIEIEDVVEINDNTAVCHASYMKYSSYDETYSPFYELYRLEDIGNGIMVLITVSIDSEETTGKTQALLDELSSFYQINIDWDDSFAETKRTAFENSDEYSETAINLSYMTFELPDGWAKDEKSSTYNEPVFAPGGNARTANVYIGITKEFSTDDYVELLLDDTEFSEQALAESMGDSVSDIKVEAVKDTFMGEVAKVEMKVYDDDIDGTGTGILYYGYSGYNVYLIAAFISDDADEDEVQDARDAIDMIFETGKLNN